MNEDKTTFDPLECLTIPQAARLLNVSEPTLRHYIRSGEIPIVPIGRCRRIQRADLEAFIAQHRASGWQPYRRELTPVDSTPECHPEAEDIAF